MSLEKIAHLAAVAYAGRDWHKLSPVEQALVSELEDSGFITPRSVPNGFVGPQTAPIESEDTHL